MYLFVCFLMRVLFLSTDHELELGSCTAHACASADTGLLLVPWGDRPGPYPVLPAAARQATATWLVGTVRASYKPAQIQLNPNKAWDSEWLSQCVTFVILLIKVKSYLLECSVYMLLSFILLQMVGQELPIILKLWVYHGLIQQYIFFLLVPGGMC